MCVVVQKNSNLFFLPDCQFIHTSSPSAPFTALTSLLGWDTSVSVSAARANRTKKVEEAERDKRGALDLGHMIKCATGCNPLVYKGYGCYCGFMGSGRVVDGIDRQDTINFSTLTACLVVINTIFFTATSEVDDLIFVPAAARLMIGAIHTVQPAEG